MNGVDGEEALAAALREALRSEEDSEAYWSAIERLREVGPEVAFRLVSPLRGDPRPAVRGLVPDVLRYFEAHTAREQSVCLVAEMLRVEGDPQVLSALAVAFVDLKHQAAEEVLPPLLRHPDPDVRESALHGLLPVLAHSNVGHFIAASRDESDVVRNWATFGLRLAVDSDEDAGPPDERIVQALRDRLDDPCAEARGEAVLALANLRDERVVPVLLRELRGRPEWDHFVEAAEIVAHPVLAPLLRDLASRYPEDADSLSDAIAACEAGVGRGG